jgi:hypothetical protein
VDKKKGGDSLKTLERWKTFTWNVKEKNEKKRYVICV